MTPNHPSAWNRFPLGRTVGTQEAVATLSPQDIQLALDRHGSGDWGDVEEQDAAANERALQTEGRIVSVYHSSASHVKFYVITEADRSYTTVLLPHEY